MACPRTSPADVRSRGSRVRLAIHGIAILIGALLTLSLVSPDPAVAADVSWANSGGGLWSNPANWSTSSVPGSSDRAIIDLAGTYVVTLDVNATVASLTLGTGAGQQTLSASSRTLTAADSVVVVSSGVLDISNSTVNASVINRGLLVARRNSAVNGASTNQTGATFRVLGAAGGSANLATGALVNRGTIELATTDGNFQSTLSGSGTLTNAVGGLIRVLPGTGGERHLAKPIVNQGTVTLDYPLYLDSDGLSQLNDVGGAIDVVEDLVLSQNSGSTFTNQGTVTISAGRYFTVSAGTFANSGAIAGAGNCVLSGVTVTGSMSAASSVLVDITNCTVNATVTSLGLLVAHRFNTFSGQLTIEAGATLRNLGGAGGSALLTLGNTVTNRGTIELTATDGNLQSNLLGNGTLTNEAGGVFRTLVGTGGERHLALRLINQGSVTLDHHLYLDNDGKNFRNEASGTIDLSAGELIVSQGGASPSFTNQGTVNVPPGRTCSITGGTFTNSGTLAGTGNLLLTSLTANLNTALTFSFANVGVTSSIIHASSGLVNGSGTILDLSISTMNGVLSNQGVLVARRNSTLNGSTINAVGATLRVLGAAGGSANLAVGPLTNNGAIELTTIDGNFQSTLSGSGPLTNETGSAFRVLPGTGGERHLATPMVNRGTVTVDYPLYLDNAGLSQLNDVGGTIDLTTGDAILEQSSGGSFTNRGTIQVGAGRVFAISGGTFLNDVAGILRGSGTISSSGPNIVNAGTISPGASPGRLSFSGNVVQTASGRIRIELSGTQPILEYDVLSCSGQLTLNGTLQLALLGGFVPPAGTAYVAIKHGSRTGTFSAFEGLDLGGGLQFQPTYTDTAVILSTGPLAILSVTSNHGGNSGVVTAVIHGVGLFAGQTVKLARGAQEIPAQVTGVSPYGTAVAVEFDLSGATLGDWDVVVQGTAGTVTLPGGFTVEASQAPRITVWILGSPRVRIGSTAYYDIVCTNEGNTDAFTVPVWIGGIPAGAPWSLSPSDADPPAFPGGPVDYSNAPLAAGSATDSTVALLLMRVPAGQSVQLRLGVRPTSSAPFALKVWSQPSFESSSTTLAPPFTLDAGSNDELVECLFGLLDFALDCGGLAVPGATCGRGLIRAYLETMIAAAHTAYSVNVVTPGDNVKNACSIIRTFGGGILAPLAVECGSEVIPILKIWEIVQCVISEVEAIAGCDGALPNNSESSVNVSPVGSFDPNDKAGPSGVGLERFVRGDLPIPYTISFENLASATAPAAEVVVADTLDGTKYDVTTVTLGPIRFGDRFFAPPPGSKSCLGTLDLRPDDNLVVRIDVRTDTNAGVITWRLSSIDPDTGAPPTDPNAGFLPPNVVQPEGQGSVQYTVLPLGGLSTGDQLGNGASIVFDANAAILTPMWTNTVDVTAPVSAVVSLSPVTNRLDFVVRWHGSDVGSRLKDYTIYRSVDGGPDSVWLINATDTSAVFIGQAGHTYAFYSVARDSAGNKEAAPVVHDAQTTIPSTVDVIPGTRVAVFALNGAWPNPADARLQISFELPVSMPGSLDLYDLAGRRVAHRDLRGLAAGAHRVALGEGARIQPGVYFVRLRQGGQEAVQKIVVSQ